MAQNIAMATRGKLNPTITDICYLAGVLDSDGCISIYRQLGKIPGIKNPRFVFSINVVNTSKELMEWLVEKFGGSYKCRRRASPNHKATYDWWFRNGKALPLLKLVEPHLIVKRRQALIGIELLEGWETNQGGQGARTSPEEVSRRERLWTQIRKLNQTGSTAATTE